MLTNQEMSVRLAELHQILTNIQAIADDIINNPNICNDHKAIFLIWYGVTLAKLKEDLEEMNDCI